MAFSSFRIPILAWTAGNTVSTQILDTTNDSLGMNFFAPKTGNITSIIAYCTAATGAATVIGSLQSVSATRNPNGTILGGGAALASVVGPSANNWITFTFGTPAAVTRGDLLSAVIRYDSGATSATFQYGLAVLGNVHAQPYSWNQNNGTYAYNQNSIPTVVVVYDDGTRVGYQMRPTSIGGSWNNAANPLLRGMKWTPNHSCKTNGLIIGMARFTDTSDFAVELYAAGSGTPVETITLDVNLTVASVGGIVGFFLPFSTERTLNAGSTYRFALRPTTANAPNTATRLDFVNSNDFLRAGWGPEWQYTTNNAQDDSWTDTADQATLIIPNITEVDSSPGGGASVRLPHVLTGGTV